MSHPKKYPLDPHNHTETVTISKWEYDSLREIARLHEQLLGLVEQKLPDVHIAFKEGKKSV